MLYLLVCLCLFKWIVFIFSLLPVRVMMLWKEHTGAGKDDESISMPDEGGGNAARVQ